MSGGKNNWRDEGGKKQQDAVTAAGFSRALRPCLRSIAILETLTLRLPAAASSSRPLMVLKIEGTNENERGTRERAIESTSNGWLLLFFVAALCIALETVRLGACTLRGILHVDDEKRRVVRLTRERTKEQKCRRRAPRQPRREKVNEERALLK